MPGGKRHKLKRALEDFKVGNYISVKKKETEQTHFENDECSLCQDATQHICRTCAKPVCILYCSVQDPLSDNESHRVHKPRVKRCPIQVFECPNWGKTLDTGSELQSHIEIEHTQVSSLTLCSKVSSEYVKKFG